jgi:hypothetical protein
MDGFDPQLLGLGVDHDVHDLVGDGGLALGDGGDGLLLDHLGLGGGDLVLAPAEGVRQETPDGGDADQDDDGRDGQEDQLAASFRGLDLGWGKIQHQR